jgi:hypothetical protein
MRPATAHDTLCLTPDPATSSAVLHVNGAPVPMAFTPEAQADPPAVNVLDAVVAGWHARICETHGIDFPLDRIRALFVPAGNAPTHVTFIDAVLLGIATPAQVDDYIAEWHARPADALTLSEWLGMTGDEYARFVKSELELDTILADRRATTHNAKTLAAVQDFCNRHGVTAYPVAMEFNAPTSTPHTDPPMPLTPELEALFARIRGKVDRATFNVDLSTTPLPQMVAQLAEVNRDKALKEFTAKITTDHPAAGGAIIDGHGKRLARMLWAAATDSMHRYGMREYLTEVYLFDHFKAARVEYLDVTITGGPVRLMPQAKRRALAERYESNMNRHRQGSRRWKAWRRVLARVLPTVDAIVDLKVGEQCIRYTFALGLRPIKEAK